MIDFRSDTVTQPTPEMRSAMYNAAVGDDVFRDDPTTNQLEETAARILGKEAALFVTSGTQGNVLGVMANTQRGDAIALTHDCHIATHELGGYAQLSSVSPCWIGMKNGSLDPSALEKAVCHRDPILEAPIRLVCVENALSDGRVVSAEQMREIYQVAARHQLAVHLDGARLFNGAQYGNVPVTAFTQYCDTVMCCLSKGLCAPVGSILAGSQKVIDTARRYRKMLGGGMRQTGFLAAAGLLALTEMPKRLGEDHGTAAYLAKALLSIPGITLAMEPVQINMVYIRLDWPLDQLANLSGALERQGILILPPADGVLRLVTHYGICEADCEQVVAAIGAYREGF